MPPTVPEFPAATTTVTPAATASSIALCQPEEHAVEAPRLMLITSTFFEWHNLSPEE